MLSRTVVFKPVKPTKAYRAAHRHAARPQPRLAPALRLSVRASAATSVPSLSEATAQPVMEKGELTQFPAAAAVYAVYDKQGTLQYIGLSRKVSATLATHMQELSDLVHTVKYSTFDDSATREVLTATWKSWMEAAIVETGSIPPGNQPGETKWQSRSVARATKSEIRLTAGKAINVPIENLIDAVVKNNKVVAFVKGTRQQPQCGFSYKMLNILNNLKADFEVVNVLDDFHNPGLRDAIKTYSQWPTIPQLYIDGEFVGGADIAEQMMNNGELQQMLRKAAGQ